MSDASDDADWTIWCSAMIGIDLIVVEEYFDMYSAPAKPLLPLELSRWSPDPLWPPFVYPFLSL